MTGTKNGRSTRRRVAGRAGIALAAALLLALGVFAFLPAARETLWTWIGGPADQGAVDVATLRRRARPTDSLACTPGLCGAPADLELPVFADAPDALMRRLDAAVLRDPGNRRVDDGTRPLYRRYVARTPAMRFPDTVDALAVPRREGSGLAIYGRSLIGKGDWGVNRRRIEGWIAALAGP